MKNLLRDFLDMVFPNVCPGCSRSLVDGEEYLCTTCELDLPFYTDQEKLEQVFAGRIKLEKMSVLLKFYRGGLTQRLLHDVKYHGNIELGDKLGQLIVGTAAKETFKNVDIIVPIPLHKAKQQQRGYNQSEVLARGMARKLKLPVETGSVIRAVQSQTQTRKTREQRWKNVSGIFRVINNDLKGKHVLLVDDVLTTGATMEACGLQLLEAGVKSLSIAALATAM